MSGAPEELAGRRGRVGALAFGTSAALGVALGWGFSVDDALISARVAHHLASGLGYRFNPAGPSVDCVTPLGWAPLLAPLARPSAWQALVRASAVGAVLWVVAASWLGRRCAAWCSGWRLLGLGLGLAALPFGAWASSGMETPLVMALGALALRPGVAGALCAGLAAGLRPELAPWAVTLALGGALLRPASVGARLGALGLAIGPVLAAAIARQLLFGRPAPLAVFAKPSDLEHGLRYALGAALLSGPPYLLLGPGWRRLPRELWAIAAAVGVHGLVLVGVGGDWMPFWRLALPVFPGVLLLGAALLGSAGALGAGARLAAVLGCAVLLEAAHGRAARAVRGERARMMGELAPLLAGARRVASLDVGWVGAAGSYAVVDLAGVTDPEVAYLPGGHTSKRLPPDFLERRRVDALVLLADESGAREAGSLAHGGVPGAGDLPAYSRQVERRVPQLRGAQTFAPVGRIALNASQSYVVLRRAQAEASP